MTPKPVSLGLCRCVYSVPCDLWLQALAHHRFVFWRKHNIKECWTGAAWGALMELTNTYSVTAEEDGLSNNLPGALTSYLGVIILFKILLHYSLFFSTTNLCSVLLLRFCLHSQSYGDCCFMIKIKLFINLPMLCRESKGKQWSLVVCCSQTASCSW